MIDYKKNVTLKNGQKVLFRHIKPSDTKLEMDMFKHFSEETHRFRFFTPISKVTEDRIKRYTHIDPKKEIAIIAQITEDKKNKMVGVVRLIIHDKKAEFAIVVADPWQGFGIGTKLMEIIFELAKKRKIEKIYAFLMHDNYIMKNMFILNGFDIIDDGEELRAVLKL